MAPVCARFVQNAWKKDMCSNCFRSKGEHASTEKIITNKKTATLAPTPVKGIIKAHTKHKSKKRTVSFSPDPVQVIGHGGEEWSDDEGVEDISSGSSEEDYSVNEEDKELEKITKLNTDHNTNLLVQNATEKRRTFTQLMLGKPQTDSDGNKQTLLVSVTPFGQEDQNKDPQKKITRSHIPIAKNKEILVERKPNVVLTAYTKSNKEVAAGAKLIKEKNESNSITEKINNETNNIILDKKELQNGVIHDEKELNSMPLPENKIIPPEMPQENEEKEPLTLEEKPDEEPEIKQIEHIVDEALKQDNHCINALPDVIIPPIRENKIPELENLEKETSPASTINCELVKSRTELTIQLAPICMDEILIKDLEESDECESFTVLPKESREQAGEPDGRADPDIISEPPALPLTPPPPLLNPRVSFLHGSPKNSPLDKPKIPSKPEKVLQLLKKVTDLPPLPSLNYINDPNKTPNKRRAPNPPPSPIIEPTFMVRSSSLPENMPPTIDPLPEPAPRRSFSVSQENLLIDIEKVEDKRKEKSRGKFSLKKFLRVGGSSKHSEMKKQEKEQLEMNKEKVPTAKPRLVIVHPSELNGSTVEVVRQEEIRVDGIAPAPPPRNLPPERLPSDIKPTPPPPKSEELLRKQHQLPQLPPLMTRSSVDNVYANLGEVRSGLTPCKPQRTASMREREALLEQKRRGQFPKDPIEHVYERVTPRRPPEDSPSERHRFKSTSLPSYNGSIEPENELIYSPCSYYGSESEMNDAGEWAGCSRPCKLRCRKGRSIVHKNLEDNYGAVVVANREALAQVLENIHQNPSLQPALRGLQAITMLRWTDFSVVDGSAGVAVGRRAFYHGLWGPHHITLALSREQGSMHLPTLGSFTMCPITEFSDLVPAVFLAKEDEEESNTSLVQASVSVMPWMHIETVHSFGSSLRARFTQGQGEEVQREVSFVLLQLINGLKSLQAQGTEEVPLSLNNLVLCKEPDREVHHRLCLLQGLNDDIRSDNEEKLGSLCQCAMAALDELLPSHRLAALLRCLLRKESAMSLSQVKSVLEFSLWGPSDVALGVPLRDRELALQRWLDLERATVLHGLVGTRVQLSVLEECHLLFLVRSSAKMMCEAALLLESNGVS